MRILVVFCHPSQDGFGAALLALTRRALEAADHELRARDLCAEDVDPVMTREDRARNLADPQANIAAQADHVADLRWCEGLIVICPAWRRGPPAMPKGWLERVWLPGVASETPGSAGARPTGVLRTVRPFTGIATSGSPWWWLRATFDPGRSLWIRGLRPLSHPRRRHPWQQLHSRAHRGHAGRKAFMARVEQALARIGGPP